MAHESRTRCNALLWLALSASLTVIMPPEAAPQIPKETLFRNIRVLDVVNGRLSSATNVLIRGNQIADIGNAVQAAADATIIDGRGRTLMPGLIDDHVHIAFSSMLLKDLSNPNTNPEQLEATAARAAREMLLRGFTAVRDAGGPIFSLKGAIDAGKIIGPRMWPSGAIISQTAGRGDFRTPSERSRLFFGKPSRARKEPALASSRMAAPKC